MGVIVERNRLPEALNGGYIEHYEIDLRRQALVLQVDVLDGGVLSHFHVLFELLSYLEYESESRSDSEARLQLTEIWIDSSPDASATEEWEVTISIFDLSHIRLRCTRITI